MRTSSPAPLKCRLAQLCHLIRRALAVIGSESLAGVRSTCHPWTCGSATITFRTIPERTRVPGVIRPPAPAISLASATPLSLIRARMPSGPRALTGSMRRVRTLKCGHEPRFRLKSSFATSGRLTLDCVGACLRDDSRRDRNIGEPQVARASVTDSLARIFVDSLDRSRT